MGLMSFVREAGEKLFGKGEAKAAQDAAAAAPTCAHSVRCLESTFQHQSSIKE